MKPYRILVTGSRDWANDWMIANMLAGEVENGVGTACPLIVVHGACPTGADKVAAEWAKVMGFRDEPHPANWRHYGVYNPQAGLARNRHMVNLGADVCLAFIRNGSRGATFTADLAAAAGIPTRRYTA